ncbi:MAG: D-alanyl-D-alanine carboxypeptidase/D-alanyl-D-alanine-endopeptidase [Solirubrobacteraceae bacterium]
MLAASALVALGGSSAIPADGAARAASPLAPALIARTQAVLSRAMHHASASSGAYVVDYRAQQSLFAVHAETPRSPASVEKLYTTSTALAKFGLDGRLDTIVLASAPPDDQGVVRGNLYLRGGGDPTFGSERFSATAYGGGATVTALARALSDTAHITRVRGSIVGDESLFDTLRGGPATGFRIDSEIGDLSALSFDRGQTGGLGSPAAYAASQLAAALRLNGVAVDGKSITGTAPPAAKLAAAIGSPPMSTLIRLANLSSDNFFAETLLKDLGAQFGSTGSTSAGAAVARRWVGNLGIYPSIVDGSGLSRADRTSPRQVVDLLRATASSRLGPALRGSLPVAARSGTLRKRLRGTLAAGHCEAKTGTLSDVSALAGWCGRRIAFAFLMTGMSVAKAHGIQDQMTAAIAALG